MGGQKKAVLVGCNYPGTENELLGCENDVRLMHDCLVEIYGFAKEDITVLIDTDPLFIQPTGANIRRALTQLVGSADPGDCLFFHFSGHGTRMPLPAGSDKEDETGYDECIVPCDENIIIDDEIRELVDKVPDGCTFTIVCDSCHSGGLIDGAKEQIGESTKRVNRDGVFGFRKFMKQKMLDSLESRGIHVEFQRQHRCYREDAGSRGGPRVRNRSLPLSSLMRNLKQKTGGGDVQVSQLRHTLFQLFGDDASPKVKKFTSPVLSKLQGGSGGEVGRGSGGGGFLGMVGSLAEQLLTQTLEASVNKHKALAGSGKGILISGCQTDQTSMEDNPTGDPNVMFGALTFTILTILGEEENISNRELVHRARDIMAANGSTQRPGLYCSDQHVDAPFIC